MGEQSTDTVDQPLIREKTQKKSNNREKLQESVVDIQSEEDNIGSATMIESEKENAKTLQRLTNPKNKEPSIYTAGKYFVISPNGLRMREGSTLSDGVITTIPYLDEVEVLDIYNVRKDTLNKKALEKGITIEEDFDLSHFAYNVIGDWIQIQYQDKIGYVFSAYLERNPEFAAVPKSNYAVQSVGRPSDGGIRHCSKNIQYWYCMIYRDDGFFLEPVSINYRTNHYLNWRDRPGYIWIAPPKRGGFLLGSTKKMSSSKIEPIVQNIKLEYDSLYAGFPMTTKLKKKSQEDLENLNFSLRKIEKGDGIELIISEGDKTQALRSDYRLDNLWPVNISLIADIDHDGKLDYQIGYYGDKTLGVTFLFLSSEAEPGQLVKEAAYYDRGWPD